MPVNTVLFVENIWASCVHTHPPTPTPTDRHDDGPARPAALGRESGGPPPWGGGHAVSEEAQTTAGTGPGTGPSAAPQARKGGRNPPPPAKRMRCLPPDALPGTEEQGHR